MRLFKTRYEVRELAKEVRRHNDIMDALRAHFDLKYTMEDFVKYCDQFPDLEKIPTSVGEFLHMYDMLTPNAKGEHGILFRGRQIQPTHVDGLNHFKESK